MKAEITKLYKQSGLFFCKFTTLISQDGSWQLQLSNLSPRPAFLLDFVFVVIFLTIIKTHPIYQSVKYKFNFYSVFASVAGDMQIYRNKRRRLHTKIEFKSYMIG